MATVEATKRRRLTQEDCDTAKYLMEHRQTLKEIGKIIGVDPSTVGKIRLADYNLEKYLAQRKAMNEKTKQNKRAAEEWKAAFLKKRWPELPPVASIVMSTEPELLPEVPGQMQMDLQPQAEEPEKKEPDEQTKQMRFQAALMDKLLKKMDELIDVLKGGAGDE